MPARAIWHGSLGFGLVSIPVSLTSAVATRKKLDFKLLDARDHAPVGYRKVNKRTGEEVPQDQLVKGYEYERDHFVVLDPAELDAAAPEATRTIEIEEFVDLAALEPLSFDTPYYLEPLPRGEKAYGLLREALRRSSKAGIAKVVLRSREHLAAVFPRGPVLVLELLRFADELRAPDELDLPGEELELKKKDLDMAGRLVEEMSGEWRPEAYEDEYRDAVLAAIDEKVETGQVTAAPAVEEGAPAEVVSITDLLERSLERAGGERGRARGKKKRRKRAGKQPA